MCKENCESNVPCFDVPNLDPSVRFRTLNVNSNQKWHVTVCSKPLDETKTKFMVGFAFCSPRNKFDRKLGQVFAFSRMNHPRSVHIVYKPDDKPLFKALACEAIIEAKRLGINYFNNIDPELFV